MAMVAIFRFLSEKISKSDSENLYEFENNN